jgi:hypothetical protein
MREHRIYCGLADSETCASDAAVRLQGGGARQKGDFVCIHFVVDDIALLSEHRLYPYKLAYVNS